MFLAFILETCSGLFISSDSRYNVCITLHIYEGVHENNTR